MSKILFPIMTMAVLFTVPYLDGMAGGKEPDNFDFVAFRYGGYALTKQYEVEKRADDDLPDAFSSNLEEFNRKWNRQIIIDLFRLERAYFNHDINDFRLSGQALTQDLNRIAYGKYKTILLFGLSNSVLESFPRLSEVA